MKPAKGRNKNKGIAKTMVMIPLYRQRVCKDKTKYSRKSKHKSNY